MLSFSSQNERETTSAITITFAESVHGDLLSDSFSATQREQSGAHSARKVTTGGDRLTVTI